MLIAEENQCRYFKIVAPYKLLLLQIGCRCYSVSFARKLGPVSVFSLFPSCVFPKWKKKNQQILFVTTCNIKYSSSLTSVLSPWCRTFWVFLDNYNCQLSRLLDFILLHSQQCFNDRRTLGLWMNMTFTCSRLCHARMLKSCHFLG